MKNKVYFAQMIILASAVLFLSNFKLFAEDNQGKALNHPWNEFTSEEFGFRVQLPESEIRQNQTSSFVPHPELLTRNQVFETPEVNDCTYRIEVLEYKSKNPEMKKWLQEIAQSAVTAFKGNSKDDVWSVKNSPKGMDEIRYKVKSVIDGYVIMDMSGKTIYHLVYICKNDIAHIKALRKRFYGSFQLIKK